MIPRITALVKNSGGVKINMVFHGNLFWNERNKIEAEEIEMLNDFNASLQKTDGSSQRKRVRIVKIRGRPFSSFFCHDLSNLVFHLF